MIINNKFYFIHIPKTGGRYLKKLFTNNFNVVGEKTLETKSSLYPDFLQVHLHYPLYIQKQKYKYFTIVRDPFDKIVSQLRFEFLGDNKIFEKLCDKDFFLNFVEKQRSFHSLHNNWYRPQVDFITEQTYVWHYSLGLGPSFREWLGHNFNLKIHKFEGNYDKFKDEEIEINGNLSKLKENIYLYFRNDLLRSKEYLRELRLQGY